MLSDTIELLLDSVQQGHPLSPKDAGVFAMKKALNAAGFGADMSEAKLLQCGVAVAALALTTIDTVEIEQACLAAETTVFASPAAAVVALTGALYWAYQTLDTLQTCNAAFSAPSRDAIEAQFPIQYGIASKRANYTNYASNVCRSGVAEPQMSF
jgi:hypothetical protein